jgi:hypothetical protein
MAEPDQVSVIIADLHLYTAREVVRLATNVDAELRESPPAGTPVDTGWAAASWMPTIGEPSSVDGRQPNGKATAAQVNARAALARQGLNDVLGWKVGAGTIFVTSNVPYIVRLNEGYSGQAPAGFVQNAIERAVRDTAAAAPRRAAFQRRAGAARQTKPRPL